MSVQSDIKGRVVEAMKAKDAVRVNVLRGLSAAFVNELVAKKRKPDEELADDEALSVISREAKKRKDSIEQFEKGGRQDLADAEKAELKILEEFLPVQMSEEEIRAYVEKKKAEANPDAAQKNQFMGMVMKELKGKADGALVKKAVDSLIN